MAQQTHDDAPPDDAVFVLAVLTSAKYVERALGVYGVAQGVSIVLASPARFTAAGYRVALGMPAAAGVWGALLAVFGAALLAGLVTGRRRVASLAGFGVGVWSISFAVSLAWALFLSPAASPTGMWVHLLAGVVALIYGTAKWQQPEAAPRLPWRMRRVDRGQGEPGGSS